jgi:hypothetical protein
MAKSPGLEPPIVTLEKVAFEVPEFVVEIVALPLVVPTLVEPNVQPLDGDIDSVVGLGGAVVVKAINPWLAGMSIEVKGLPATSVY